MEPPILVHASLLPILPPQKKSADQDEKDGLHDLAPILDLFSQYSVLLLRRRRLLLLLLLLVLLLPLLPLLQLLYLITVRLATYDLQTNLQTSTTDNNDAHCRREP